MVLYLKMAIEALRGLDSDNRMVARCRDYLEQLVQVVRALGTVTSQNLIVFILTRNSRRTGPSSRDHALDIRLCTESLVSVHG
jgi:hypothetical protein